jgi:hypothetical protein
MIRKLLFAMSLTLTLAVPARAELDDDVDTYIRANTIFFIYHELGHALIDRLRLPVFGQEEDAADVLGIVLSETINSEEDNTLILTAAADNFAYMAATAEEEGYELPLWDTHGLDMQRYYTLVCLHYGADPGVRQGVADDLDLPEDRQATCSDEFQLAEESWGAVLDEIAPRDGEPAWLTLEIAARPETEAEAVVLDALEIEVDVLNQALSAPFDMVIAFGRCGQANAWYDSSTGNVTICAELGALFTE